MVMGIIAARTVWQWSSNEEAEKNESVLCTINQQNLSSTATPAHDDCLGDHQLRIPENKYAAILTHHLVMPSSWSLHALTVQPSLTEHTHLKLLFHKTGNPLFKLTNNKLCLTACLAGLMPAGERLHARHLAAGVVVRLLVQLLQT